MVARGPSRKRSSSVSSQLERLIFVMAELRSKCSWDASQTHESLLNHLIEETSEVVDAVEVGGDDELREELGDLLLQVYFHSQIASERDSFDIEDVARGICDKLVSRHPHIFGDAQAPSDANQAWEQRKREEKGRTSSLDGIAESMSVLARTHKVVSRARAHEVAVELPSEPITADEAGKQIVALVARAQQHGIDADAAARGALRHLESQIRDAEQG